MTQREFRYLLDGIQIMSPEQMRQLRDEVDRKLAEWDARGEHLLTAEQQADQDVQRRMFDAGVLSEIKPPMRASTGTERFTPVPIQGEPLSETVIRERR